MPTATARNSATTGIALSAPVPVMAASVADGSKMRQPHGGADDTHHIEYGFTLPSLEITQISSILQLF